MELSSILLPLLRHGVNGSDSIPSISSTGWNGSTQFYPDAPTRPDDDTSFDFSHNFSVNGSFLEFTTMTSTKQRQRQQRQARMPTSPFVTYLDENVMPAAICLGIVGNILLFPVFAYTPLGARSLAHFLAAVGVSDFIYLVSSLVVWVNEQGFGVYHVIGVCQLTNFILRLSRFLGTWYLFAAHVERFFVHFDAFHARAWCSPFRTKFIIIFIFVFSMVGFLHYIWTHIVMEHKNIHYCSVMQESVPHLIQLEKIEMVAATFLPMLLIIAIDITLCSQAVVKRYQYYFRVSSKTGSVKNEHDQDDLGDYVLAPGHGLGSPASRARETSLPPPDLDLALERWSATVVVVISGLIYIGLLLPPSVQKAKFSFARQRPTEKDLVTMKLFERLVNFNSIYKFILYFIVLRSFRYGLLYLFRCKRDRKPSESSIQETTEV